MEEDDDYDDDNDEKLLYFNKTLNKGTHSLCPGIWYLKLPSHPKPVLLTFLEILQPFLKNQRHVWPTVSKKVSYPWPKNSCLNCMSKL
jgi:hypothetical protein